ncbi:hypothetical protein C8J56DRAFT_989226, partial [Mycena floridula]
RSQSQFAAPLCICEEQRWTLARDERQIGVFIVVFQPKERIYAVLLAEQGPAARAGGQGSISLHASTVAASMKKRKAPDVQDEDKGSKVPSSPFIGPVLPDSSDAKRRKLSEVDPQADLVKKIEEANKKSGAMDSLASYGSDDDEQTEKQNVEASLTMPTPESSPVKPPKPEESPSTSIPSISPRVFYPSSRPPKSPSGFNSSPNGPYSRSRMTNVFNTYGKKKTFRPRGF